MKNSYKELIEQTYYFPQEGFHLEDETLRFNHVNLMELINTYGTPFRLTYLPKIREQIVKARSLFHSAIQKYEYKGSYEFCYCTKCCHFSHVVKTALKEDVSLETSSAFDIDLVFKLYAQGKLQKDITIVHNGIKTDEYIQKIILLQKEGFENSITILDSVHELDRILQWQKDTTLKIGLRVSIEEEPQAAYYTSRLGINKRELLDLVTQKIVPNPLLELKMVHFFVDSGINDNLYYWGEFKKGLDIYTQIKKVAPALHALNIGGGFPTIYPDLIPPSLDSYFNEIKIALDAIKEFEKPYLIGAHVSEGTSSATILPSRMTRIRSLSPRISVSSDEIIKIPIPSWFK